MCHVWPIVILTTKLKETHTVAIFKIVLGIHIAEYQRITTSIQMVTLIVTIDIHTEIMAAVEVTNVEDTMMNVRCDMAVMKEEEEEEDMDMTIEDIDSIDQQLSDTSRIDMIEMIIMKGIVKYLRKQYLKSRVLK